VEVFDVAGRRVRSLFRGALEAGVHEHTWDGRDDRGRFVGTGVYVVVVRAGRHVATAKLVTFR
jgi:flagellar hook assembly protein FlgD